MAAAGTEKFVQKGEAIGYGGSNNSINQRLDDSFNQWTRTHNDECGYVNDIRVLRKPMKYYVNKIFPPAPNNETEFSYFTPVGNQKAYDVRNNLNFPTIGNPTTLGNRRFATYVMPLNTSPLLGNNAVNRTDIDVNSNLLRFGELTNKNILTKDVTTSVDFNRWDFVDKETVQNVNNIIFANGVIPRGCISTRNELQNYSSLNNC